MTSGRDSSQRQPIWRVPEVPGGRLLHPCPLAAALLIAFNDFWLKVHHSGWVAGKLSDVGICFLLPVVLLSLWEWGVFVRTSMSGRTWRPAGRRAALVCCLIAGAYFALLQLVPEFTSFHMWWLRWLFPPLQPGVYMDVSDLVTLPMTAVSYLYLLRSNPGPSRMH